MLRRLPLLVTLVLLAAVSAQSQTVLTAAQLQNGQAVELDKLGWKYAPHDAPQFAEPQFDDSAWETLKGMAITLDSIPNSGWRGLGWFRLRLKVDPALADVPLNLDLFHLGASEVYLDGKLIGRFGVVGKTQAEETTYNPNASPLGIVFSEAAEHVLALRYSNQPSSEPNSFWRSWQLGIGTGIGWKGRIKHFGDATNKGRWYSSNFTLSYDVFQGAVSLTLGILHLLLFVLFPRQRSNLYYSLFLLGIALNNYFLIRMKSLHSGLAIYYLEEVANMIVGVPNNVFLLAFVYTAFKQRLPRRIWLFAAVGSLVAILQALHPGTLKLTIEGFFILAVALETLRVTYPAVLQNQPGAWMVGLGLSFNLVYAIRSLFYAAVSIPQTLYVAMDIVATYGLMLAISLYLAREFARVNKGLEEQLVQVKQLSAAALEHEKVKAENERRARELEEARQLQLSMLPKKLPDLPHLDLAAYMKTASEVGGDYYDFLPLPDGRCCVVIGDATGHGMSAGLIVGMVKMGLTSRLQTQPELRPLIEDLNTALKQSLTHRGVGMCLGATMIDPDTLAVELSSNGMPFPYHFEAAQGSLRPIVLKAPPLGFLKQVTLQTARLQLRAGDALIWVSDGLEERMNADGEVWGTEQVAATLLESCRHATSGEAIARDLLAACDAAAAGRNNDDDMTIVVVKVK